MSSMFLCNINPYMPNWTYCSTYNKRSWNKRCDGTDTKGSVLKWVRQMWQGNSLRTIFWRFHKYNACNSENIPSLENVRVCICKYMCACDCVRMWVRAHVSVCLRVSVGEWERLYVSVCKCVCVRLWVSASECVMRKCMRV